MLWKGAILGEAFLVQDLLGSGSFGSVVRAVSLASGRVVAIKISRNPEEFVRQAYHEIAVLNHIQSFDPAAESLCGMVFLPLIFFLFV